MVLRNKIRENLLNDLINMKTGPRTIERIDEHMQNEN